MDDCHFGYLEKFPKNKSTASREYKEMGMGKDKIFHFVTYQSKMHPTTLSPQQLLVKPEFKNRNYHNSSSTLAGLKLIMSHVEMLKFSPKKSFFF